MQVYGCPERADRTRAVEASPIAKPRLPDWNGRQASSGWVSVTATPSLTKWAVFSGVHEMSVATTITSSATPPSSHAFAVIIAAFPDAHIADTFRAGPWNPNSCIA